MDLMQWMTIALSVLIACTLVSVAHWLLTHQLSKVWRLAVFLVARCRVSAYVAAAAIGVNIGMPTRTETEDRDLYGVIAHMLEITMIIGLTWLAASVAYAITDSVLDRLAISNGDADRRSRRLQTQVRLLRRVATGIIVVIATAAVLFTFEAVRPLGAGLLTSAGLLGVVAGVAAQSTLGNLFAGLQLTFSDALRINDIVVFDGEWGRVEELSLTNVTLRIWDERRLVIPVSEFTLKPFENWTKQGTQLTAVVMLRTDWNVPVAGIREATGAFVANHPLWDGRRWALQATDILEGGDIELRAVATVADSDARWDLSCDLREHLINYIGEHYPEAVPRSRTEITRGTAADRDDAGAATAAAAAAASAATAGGRGTSAQAPDGALSGAKGPGPEHRSEDEDGDG